MARNTTKVLTANQITTATTKAYKDYEPSALVKETLEADITTRLARYDAGVAARKEGFSGTPSVKDAKATETAIRGKSGNGKKTMAQLVTSATAAIAKLDSKSKETVFAALGVELGYDI